MKFDPYMSNMNGSNKEECKYDEIVCLARDILASGNISVTVSVTDAALLAFELAKEFYAEAEKLAEEYKDNYKYPELAEEA